MHNLCPNLHTRQALDCAPKMRQLAFGQFSLNGERNGGSGGGGAGPGLQLRDDRVALDTLVPGDSAKGLN